MPSHMRRIKPHQANRAIYLDFEGFKGKPPAIAGFSFDNQFEQVVLDPVLEGAAAAHGLSVLTLDEFVRNLLDECKTNGRFIIAFSDHERAVILRELDLDIRNYYKNALRLANRWRHKYHPHEEWGKASLARYLELPGIDYEIPSHLGKGSATARLRSVSEGLETRGDYAKLVASQKKKWADLLEYNRHDVLALEYLTRKAAEELKRAKRKTVRSEINLSGISWQQNASGAPGDTLDGGRDLSASISQGD